MRGNRIKNLPKSTKMRHYHEVIPITAQNTVNYQKNCFTFAPDLDEKPSH